MIILEGRGKNKGPPFTDRNSGRCCRALMADSKIAKSRKTIRRESRLIETAPARRRTECRKIAPFFPAPFVVQ